MPASIQQVSHAADLMLRVIAKIDRTKAGSKGPLEWIKRAGPGTYVGGMNPMAFVDYVSRYAPEAMEGLSGNGAERETASDDASSMLKGEGAV